MDGWVTIGTKIDNKQLEQELKDTKAELKEFQKDEEKLLAEKGKLESSTGNFKEEQKELFKLSDEAKKYKEELKKISDEKNKMLSNTKVQEDVFSGTGNAEYESLLQTQSSVQAKLDEINSKIEKSKAKIKASSNEYLTQINRLSEIAQELEENKNEQKNIQAEVAKITKEIEKENTAESATSKSTSGISSKTSEIIGKVAQWALAVFSVRSAYSLLSRASSTLSNYNKQYASDLQYIQYVIAQTLAPILEYVVKLVYKILTYVNYVANAWLGVNLFANASTDSFLAAANAAEEVSNATAGFDKANILSDTSSSSSSSVVAPSVDLSSIEDVEIPEWLTKIVEFFQPVIDFFKECIEKYGPVATAIGAVVAAIAGFFIIKSIVSLFTSLGNTVSGVSVNFTGFFNSLGKAAEAIAILGGISLVISQITNLITAFSDSGLTLGEVAGLVGIILGELAAAFLVLAAASNLMDWQAIAGAAVILAGFALVIHEVADLLEVFSASGLELNDVIGLMATIFVTLIALMGSVAVLGPLMTTGLVPFLAVVVSISAILIVMANTLPTILSALSDFITSTAPAVVAILEIIGTLIQVIIEQLGESLPPIIESVGSLFNKIFNGISSVVNSVGGTIVSILNAVKNLISTTLSSLQSFINSLGPSIESFTNSAISSATKLINFMISGIEYLVNTLIVAGINKIIQGVNSVSKYVGITISTVPQQSFPRFTAKLATGAIINYPGQGVPVAGGQAIAGEAGREGIIPLTDSQAMQELGEEIGKWIVVNLTSITKLDSRVISRQLNKINNEKSFAKNGG